MTTPVLFAGLVAIMSGLAGATLARHGDLAGSRRLWVVAAAALCYVVVPGVLAASGRLEPTGPLPLVMPLLLVINLTTVAVAFSPLGHRLATSLSLGALVGYQAFRFPLELLLHRLATAGEIPMVMTYTGRNFDIVTGLTAAVLGLWLVRGRVPIGLVMVWNVMGLLLLGTIMTIAVLASPGPLQRLTDGPPNLLPVTFPYVWPPTFLVQLALAGHLLAFRRLRAEATRGLSMAT